VWVRVHPQEEALHSLSNNVQTPRRQDHLACHRPFFDHMSLFFIVGAGVSLSTYMYVSIRIFGLQDVRAPPHIVCHTSKYGLSCQSLCKFLERLSLDNVNF